MSNNDYKFNLKNLSIELAEPSDASFLSALALKSKAHWGYSEEFLSKCIDALTISPKRISGGRFKLIKSNEKIIGFFGFSDEPEEFEMTHLFVDPEFIGKGIGIILWNNALEFVKALGKESFIIISDPFAEKSFYSKMGAIRIGERNSEVDSSRQLPILLFDFKFSESLKMSIEYLNSPEAIKSIEADPYWPKWNSTWWHMLLLFEMGEAKQIPLNVVESYVAALSKTPLKIFPINPEDMPIGVDPYRESPCHCQLGNVYQVLSACGVDVDSVLPWLRPWFLRYQMADGGLSCDNEAYLVKDEVPSSMVGTIAVFEAILLYTNRDFTTEEKQFLKKGAEFLIGRQLMYGSNTKHNAAERKSAELWMKLCFPRFYLYDVLRGLTALLKYSEKTGDFVPVSSIREVVKHLNQRFPNDKIIIERKSYEGVGTILQTQSGEWILRQPATLFPLLTTVSQIGEESPFLTKQWLEAKSILERNPELKVLL